MSRVTELEKALTTLFRKGTEVGYTETEIDEFLENIDYHALLQAVWNKAETVYAYRADGKNALSLDYRSSELFKQRATLVETLDAANHNIIPAFFETFPVKYWCIDQFLRSFKIAPTHNITITYPVRSVKLRQVSQIMLFLVGVITEIKASLVNIYADSQLAKKEIPIHLIIHYFHAPNKL